MEGSERERGASGEACARLDPLQHKNGKGGRLQRNSQEPERFLPFRANAGRVAATPILCPALFKRVPKPSPKVPQLFRTKRPPAKQRSDRLVLQPASAWEQGRGEKGFKLK